MPTLLIVDDETAILHAFQRAFRDTDYAVRTASSAADAVASFTADRPDAVILDVHLPDASGLDTFLRLKAVDARTPVILVTGHGTTELAIRAMKEGAFEYLLKPLELRQLRELVDRACRSSRLMHVPAVLEGDSQAAETGDVLVGRCPAMQDVYKAIGRVAAQDITVLILGESGTGKELVARAVYQHSKRAERPFLAINCAAIPEALLESELFGHEKGAFTGADRKRIGKFEQCSGGTIFLDEVGDMTPLTQTKVLRLLQDQSFERVGGNELVRTDVRLVAATNADLDTLVAAGRFRKDLFFRLNVFTIRLPPLRERGEDIRLLTEHYVRRFGRELGKPATTIAPETLAVLARYNWPGNVRELQSVLKQALVQMSGSVFLPECLPAHVHAPVDPTLPTAAGTLPLGEGTGTLDWDRFVAERLAAQSEDLYAETLQVMERELLVRVLQHCEGNQVQASRILGITRGCLRGKIRSLHISIERNICADDNQGE